MKTFKVSLGGRVNEASTESIISTKRDIYDILLMYDHPILLWDLEIYIDKHLKELNDGESIISVVDNIEYNKEDSCFIISLLHKNVDKISTLKKIHEECIKVVEYYTNQIYPEYF